MVRQQSSQQIDHLIDKVGIKLTLSGFLKELTGDRQRT